MKHQAKYVKRYKPLAQRQREQKRIDTCIECVAIIICAATMVYAVYLSLPGV